MTEFEWEGWSGMASQWPPQPQAHCVLLLHGAGLSAGFWQDLLEMGLEDFVLIAPNLPGHGDSRQAAADQVDIYVQQVRDLVESLGLQNVVLTGHSMGGAISLRLLQQAPSWLRGAVLLSTGARLRVLPQILETVQRNYAAYLAHFVQFAVGAGADKTLMAQRLNQIATQRDWVAYGDFKACDSFDMLGQIDQIHLPVLVLHGASDQVTPLKYGEYLAQSLPHARMHAIPDVGHLMPMEAPDEVRQNMLHFLMSLPAKA